MGALTWVRGFNGTVGRLAPHAVASKMRRTFMTPRDLPPRDWELPLLAQSERITLRFGLSALRWGHGPAVLLMHGWEGRPTQFASLITALVDNGYSVIALDGPAHGRSPGREAHVLLFARAMLEAAAELPPLYAVVGHSMGGASAMLAVQLGLRTQALVSIAAPSRFLDVLRGFTRMVGLPPRARSAFIQEVELSMGMPLKHLDVAPLPIEHSRSDRARRGRHLRSGQGGSSHSPSLVRQPPAAPGAGRPSESARRPAGDRRCTRAIGRLPSTGAPERLIHCPADINRLEQGMGWDLATPFIIDLQVAAEDIDGLGHANNAVYVSWLERCAWRHSQRLGLDLTEYRRLDRAMAVVRHEIDYLAAGYEGDELQLATWIVDWDQRLKMTRRFQLVRPRDGATLLRAQTTFVCIELSSGKPKRMPAEFIDGYGPALTGG